jgi:hypothetical protein
MKYGHSVPQTEVSKDGTDMSPTAIGPSTPKFPTKIGPAPDTKVHPAPFTPAPFTPASCKYETLWAWTSPSMVWTRIVPRRSSPCRK